MSIQNIGGGFVILAAVYANSGDGMGMPGRGPKRAEAVGGGSLRTFGQY